MARDVPGQIYRLLVDRQGESCVPGQIYRLLVDRQGESCVLRKHQLI
jgi:hypothetical protein